MLRELGILGLILGIILLVFVPVILTIILGIAFANMLGFTGIVWWAFVIIFYLFVGGVLGALTRIGN